MTQEFAFDHHFLPLDPPLSSDEAKALACLGQLNFDTRSGHQLKVRLLGSKKGVSVIAVTVPAAARKHEDLERWMEQILETAIASIRLSYSPEAIPLYMGRGHLNLMHQSNDPEPKLEAEVRFGINEGFELDIRSVLGVFEVIAKGKEINRIACLIAEAGVPSLPPHYRVLSLVRAFELMWPEQKDQSAELDKFQTEFAALEISGRPFRNAIWEIRNRCAHGQGRGREDNQPLIGIGQNQVATRDLADLLSKVLAEGLASRFGIVTATGTQDGYKINEAVGEKEG